jgi:hypothetical protein
VILIGDGGGIGGIMGSDFAFDLRHMRERLIPTSFQFASHQPIGRVRSVVLPEGAIGCIASAQANRCAARGEFSR